MVLEIMRACRAATLPQMLASCHASSFNLGDAFRHESGCMSKCLTRHRSSCHVHFHARAVSESQPMAMMEQAHSSFELIQYHGYVSWSKTSPMKPGDHVTASRYFQVHWVLHPWLPTTKPSPPGSILVNFRLLSHERLRVCPSILLQGHVESLQKSKGLPRY
jgi:hypothetical protein